MLNFTKKTPHIKIGSRASKLALTQAQMVIKAISELKIDFTYEIITKITAGDRFKIHPSEFSHQGIFTKELDLALINKEIDIAVHSMKDMPTKKIEKIFICGTLKRALPNEALISNKFSKLKNIEGIVGTSSARRKAQILNINPRIQIVNLRGNVQRRIEQVNNESINATILSFAGLKRLNLSHLASEVISTKILLPAPCQGIISMQCRESDFQTIDIIKKINNAETMAVGSTEREFLRLMNAGCGSPIAGLVEIINDKAIGNFEILSKNGEKKYSVTIEKQANKTYEIAKEAANILKYKKHLWINDN